MLGAAFASLRVRLLLLTLVVLVPALGVLVYAAIQARENQLDEVRARVLYLARLAAAEESKIVQSTRQLLDYLAQTPEARGGSTQAACDAMVARQIKLHPHYDNLGVIGTNGIRFCSVLLPGQPVDLSSRSYFRRAVETRDFSVGDYQIGNSSGSAAVGFGYPVLDGTGALRAVVYATLSLEWFGQSLARAQLPAEASLTVVDSRGTILARFPDTESQVGKQIAQEGLKYMLARGDSGTFEGVGSDAIRRVWGFVPLHQQASGAMFVRVSLPTATAHAGINHAFYRNLLLIAATALLIMGVAWVGGERLVMRPVKRLTEAAQHLTMGDLGARTRLPHASGEFGQLARVFDVMAESIQSEEAALERLMALQQEANERLLAGMTELERLNREITQLSRMSQVLQACQSVEVACAAVVQSGQILFPTEVAALYLMRSSNNRLEYETGWGGVGTDEPALAPESCWALRRGEVYRFDPLGDGPGCAHVAIEAPRAPYICAPLVGQGEILGLLHIRFPAPEGATAARPIESRLQLATTFAVQAGLALANLKLREVLKEQSIRDPLTGLYNRRFLEEALLREMSRVRRAKAPLTLIMADIDHFKRFNDSYGHDAGDAVLRAVAQTLKSQVRGSDIACRLGGEEFTLVLTESALDAARDRAEGLRQAIASLALRHAGQSLGTVTMSFGLATFPEHGGDSAELLQAADLALYKAKNNGRNRVEVAHGATAAVA